MGATRGRRTRPPNYEETILVSYRMFYAIAWGVAEMRLNYRNCTAVDVGCAIIRVTLLPRLVLHEGCLMDSQKTEEILARIDKTIGKMEAF